MAKKQAQKIILLRFHKKFWYTIGIADQKKKIQIEKKLVLVSREHIFR